MTDTKAHIRRTLTRLRVRPVRSCLALLCAVGLFSCSQNDKTIEPTESRTETVTIRARANTGAGTRATGDPVPDGLPAVLGSGLMVFSEADGTVRSVKRVLPTVSGGDVIGIDDLMSAEGVKVEGIPTECAVIDFFGNVPSGISRPAEDSDIALFRALNQDITALWDNSGWVNNVGLYGSGTITYRLQGGECNLMARQAGSRVEIAKFVRDTENIDYFEVDGIFVNNFYSRATLTAATDADDIVYYNSGGVFAENGEPFYATGYKGRTFDADPVSHMGVHNQGDYYPATAGKVWAYNVFSGEVPHIVVKLSNVRATQKLKDEYGGEDPFARHTHWYITVTGMKYNGQSLQATQRGYVYHMAGIEVSPETLGPTPEPKDNEIDVDVRLKIIDWIPVDASTDLPHLPW